MADEIEGRHDRVVAPRRWWIVLVERYRLLVAQDSIQRQQLDTQQSLVHQDEGAVKNDQGLIESATVNLTYCRIVSPIGGQVGLRLVDPGNIVHATDTNAIVVVPQLQPISVVFTIPEDSLPAVLAKLAHGVRMPAEAYDREQRRKLSVGSLLTVDNQIDPITGTVKLNPPGADRASRGPAPRLSNRALQRSRPSSNSTSRRRLR